MEVISKPELDQSLLRIPTHVKRVLRSGELGTYDVLELMGNTVNASADEVNRSTEWVEVNGEILRQNEDERIANENDRIENDVVRENNEAARKAAELLRKAAEESRVEAEDLRVEAENGRDAAEQVREEIINHQPFIDDDGFLNEYNIETHTYYRREDRYMRGGVDYPSMRVLNSMHLYVLPVANGNQFKVTKGHLTFTMKTISA